MQLGARPYAAVATAYTPAIRDQLPVHSPPVAPALPELLILPQLPALSNILTLMYYLNSLPRAHKHPYPSQELQALHVLPRVPG